MNEKESQIWCDGWNRYNNDGTGQKLFSRFISLFYLNAPVSPGTVGISGGIGISTLRTRNLTRSLNVGLALVTHIRLVSTDKLQSQFVQLVEVVRGMGGSDGLPSQPSNIFSQGFDVLIGLGFGVGVIVTKDGLSVLRRNAQLFESKLQENPARNDIKWTVIINKLESKDTYIKVHVHRLSMANVKVTIGLRRESGANNGAVDRCMLSNELLRVHSRRQLSRYQAISTRASFSVVSVSHGYVLV